MNMQRRQFGKFAAGAALVSSAGVVPLTHAQAKKPQAGTEYQVLDPRAAVDAPAGKIEVVEFSDTVMMRLRRLATDRKSTRLNSSH